MSTVLATPRLLVRQFTTADVDPLHLLCGDRRTMRYVGDGMVLDRQRCAEWIDECRASYAAGRAGGWALELHDQPGLAGYAGITSARRRADPELIYLIRRDRWGQGLASELVPALIDHGFNALGAKRLVATVRPENVASVRVLEKSGMHCAGEEYAAEGILMLIYALDRQ